MIRTAPPPSVDLGLNPFKRCLRYVYLSLGNVIRYGTDRIVNHTNADSYVFRALDDGWTYEHDGWKLDSGTVHVTGWSLEDVARHIAIMNQMD